MPFAHDFQPPLHSFGDALYLVGSALATVGLSPHYPHGPARWIDPRAPASAALPSSPWPSPICSRSRTASPARHRHHQAQHLGRRSALGADPARAVRRDPQPGAIARRSARSAQLVRDRPAEPLGSIPRSSISSPPHRRRLAGGARRAARPRVIAELIARRRGACTAPLSCCATKVTAWRTTWPRWSGLDAASHGASASGVERCRRSGWRESGYPTPRQTWISSIASCAAAPIIRPASTPLPSISACPQRAHRP